MGDAFALRLAFIRRHGPQTTPYIFKAGEHLQRNYNYCQHYLTKLCNETETEHGGPYLVRIDPRPMESCAYDITEAAEALLEERGMLDPYIPLRVDHMSHRLRNAAFSASMELGAGSLTYVSQSGVLSHPACPDETRNLPNPLELTLSGACSRKTLIPDFLSAYRYPETNLSRVFSPETDCGTEHLVRSGKGTSIAEKLEGYIDILERKQHIKQWGVRNLTIPILTTSKDRMNNIIKLLIQMTTHNPKLREHFCFKWKKGLMGRWKPLPIMTDLVTDPWMTTTTPFFINKP